MITSNKEIILAIEASQFTFETSQLPLYVYQQSQICFGQTHPVSLKISHLYIQCKRCVLLLGMTAFIEAIDVMHRNIIEESVQELICHCVWVGTKCSV